MITNPKAIDVQVLNGVNTVATVIHEPDHRVLTLPAIPFGRELQITNTGETPLKIVYPSGAIRWLPAGKSRKIRA